MLTVSTLILRTAWDTIFRDGNNGRVGWQQEFQQDWQLKVFRIPILRNEGQAEGENRPEIVVDGECEPTQVHRCSAVYLAARILGLEL